MGVDLFGISKPHPSFVMVGNSTLFANVNLFARRFDIEYFIIGTAVKHINSVDYGSMFKIMEDGLYSINYSDQFNTSAGMGIVLNGKEQASIFSLTDTRVILGAVVTSAANKPSCVSVTAPLNAGDIIQCIGDNVPSGTVLDGCRFTICKIGNTTR